MVRIWFATRCAIALLAIGAFAQGASREGQPIRLTGSLGEQTYCRGDRDTFSIHFRLALHAVNQTSDALIVIGNFGKADYTVQMARTAEELDEGKYEYNPNLDYFEDLPDAPRDADLSKEFIVLKPDDTFESTTNVAVVASHGLGRPARGTVTPGKHSMQVTLSAWPYRDPPDETAKRWKQYGRLVAQPLTTEPIAIDIPPDAPVYSCR